MKPSYFKNTESICILIALAIILSPVNSEASAKVWVKDPFKPPAFLSREKLSSSLTLSAILFGSERSSVIINGQRVGLGDSVKGYKLIDIKKTYVILSKAGRRVRLEMQK